MGLSLPPTGILIDGLLIPFLFLPFSNKIPQILADVAAPLEL